MKTKIQTAIVLSLLLIAFLPAEIIKQQGFEGTASDTWNYSVNPATYYETGSPYHVWSRDDDLPGSPYKLLPLPDAGDYLWNAENTEAHSSDLHKITMSTVDISSYTGDVTVHFHYQTLWYGSQTGSWSGTGDTIGYYVEYDNGSDWGDITLLNTGTNDWVEVELSVPSDSDYVRLCFAVKNDEWQEIGTFDYIYIEHTEAPTPISLAGFTATALNEGVELNWTTESESENSGFVIYRNDEAIAFVEGAGTSSETHQYSYLDKNIIPGCTYTYVLADLSYDNDEVKHENKAVTLTVNEEAISEKSFIVKPAYPNPFNPNITLDYQLNVSNNVEIFVHNMKGEKVATLQNGAQDAGAYSLNWNADNMESGIYFLSISVGSAMETQKLLLVK